MSRRSCSRSTCPAVILGTVLGHLLDRVPPRTGLAACELLAAAAWALMVTTGRAGTIVALALLCGVATGIFKIVSMAIVPMLVDDDELDAANGSILSAQTLTSVAGVAVGGALVGLTSANDVLLLNAASFVFSGVILLAFSRVPRRAPASPEAGAERRPRLAAALAGGRAAAASRTPALRMIMLSLPVASVGLGIAIAAIVPTLRDTYGASNLQTGAIMALDGLGIAIGTTLPARYAGYLSGLALLAIGWGGFGIAPDLLARRAALGHRRHRQRHRDRALPHDDAAQHGAARAREHVRVRVRGDVQHDCGRPGPRRSAVSRSASARRSRCRHDLRGRRSRECADVAEDGRGAAAARRDRSHGAPPSVHDNHDYDK